MDLYLLATIAMVPLAGAIIYVFVVVLRVVDRWRNPVRITDDYDLNTLDEVTKRVAINAQKPRRWFAIGRRNAKPQLAIRSHRGPS